jgi:hypothetical protein
MRGPPKNGLPPNGYRYWLALTLMSIRDWQPLPRGCMLWGSHRFLGSVKHGISIDLGMMG